MKLVFQTDRKAMQGTNRFAMFRIILIKPLCISYCGLEEYFM
jgi:hypothetical protein